MQPPLHTAPSRRTLFLAVALPAALMLVGAGCMSLGDRLAEDALTPVTVPIDVLQKSEAEIAQVNAKKYEDAEASTADVSVALIRIAGEVPFTGETIGCGDMVETVQVHREAMSDSVLRDALTTLFAIKASNYDGFHNSLWQSDLAVENILSRDGVTTEVWLKGPVISGGACDDPRIKAQIEHTIKRFKPKYQIFLNGTEAAYRCLGDMSGECQ